MLDSLDRKLLAALQRDNSQSMVDLGEAVGLSEPATRRRVARLRKDGFILADVSLIDPARVGITVITAIRFGTESRSTYDAFKQEIVRTPEITQCYTVTGDEDFVLIGHFPDMVSYDDWINARILTNPAISRSTTQVVYRRVKFETAIPV
jgi:Lrp/AsnC family transcriptional regulator, leucine-responsive regulatory protein